jgi:serine/threonine-protein kinase
MAVVNDEPPAMSAVREDLPDGFEAVVMRCLRKDPAERFADVGELAEALAPFGPKNATTSASRIQIVLRRIRVDSAAVISHEFATVEPTSEHERHEAALDRRESARQATARGAPAAQSPAPVPVPATRGRSRGLIGALIGGILVVVLAIIIVWRGRSDSAVAPEPGVVEHPAPAAPIVEPIIEEPSKAAAPTPPPTPAVPPAAGPTTGAPISPSKTAEPSPRPEPASKIDHKKRKPGRPAVAGPRGRAGAGSGSGARGSGADAGSDDDDKWMHMTHDEKKP